jgi:DNA-binding transcriptional ArsR family regulator
LIAVRRFIYNSVNAEMRGWEQATSERFADTVAAFRALGDENRMRIVLALRERALCVCRIGELLQLAASTVSEHPTALRTAGLISGRKEGRWVYYRIVEEQADLLQGALRFLETDCLVRTDVRLLAGIVRIDPSELCRRQKTKGRNRVGSVVNRVWQMLL